MQLILQVSSDFTTNIVASLVYTFARQIVVFPLLAAHMSEDSYGTLLTVTGLCNVCSALIGNTLNNIRLVQNSEYEERNIHGDFNFLCLIGSALSLVFGLVLGWIFRLPLPTVTLIALFLPIATAYQYANVHFRLMLDFKRNLIACITMSISYVVAALLCSTEILWPFIFLAGELTGLIYTIMTTGFLKEPLTCTPLFAETTRKSLLLMSSSLVANLLMYADRMIIYPILGAASVSYYSTASFFGKSAGIVMTPIAGVLLSYFAQKNFRASRKLFIFVNVLSVGCLVIFAVFCWFLAPWCTRLLYPTLYASAAPYIMLANLGAVIAIAGNMAQPMILKFCSTRWILAIQMLYGGTYLVSAFVLMPLHGLIGFCWATIVANVVRLLALYAIGFVKFG